MVCQCLVFEPCLVLHTGGRWTSLRADACCLWSSPSTRALLAVLIRALRIGYPYRPPCLPHVPEAQGSLPIVALLLYARGDGSLTYVPSLSTGASRATREEPTPSEAQRVICALALGTVEPAPRPGKRQLAPPSYWIGV